LWFNNIQVVSSRYWPQISRYKAVVRSQSSKVEMISSLFKPVSDTKDDGIIRFVFSIISDYCYKQKVISCYTIVNNSTRLFVYWFVSLFHSIVSCLRTFVQLQEWSLSKL
jgi:hypothetical protein